MKSDPVNREPQFQLGASSDEAELYAQIVHSDLGGPGDIAGRMGMQFQYPRAQTTTMMSDRPGTNVGES